DREQPDVVIHAFGERRMLHPPDEPSVSDFRATFGDLLLDDPKAVVEQRRSRTLLDAARPFDALAANDLVLAAVGPAARLLVFRARVLEALGETDAALEVLRHATVLDPSDAFPQHAAGRLERTRGASDRASEWLERA